MFIHSQSSASEVHTYNTFGRVQKPMCLLTNNMGWGVTDTYSSTECSPLTENELGGRGGGREGVEVVCLY